MHYLDWKDAETFTKLLAMTIVKWYWCIRVTCIETSAPIWNVNNCVTFHEVITGKYHHAFHCVYCLFNPKVHFTHAFGQQTLEASSNWKLKKCVREIGLPFPCNWKIDNFIQFEETSSAPFNSVKIRWWIIVWKVKTTLIEKTLYDFLSIHMNDNLVILR